MASGYDPAAKAAYYQANKDEIRAKARARYRADPAKEKQRTSRRRAEKPEQYHAMEIKRKYGLTPAQYDAMVIAQDGRCAICRRRPKGRLVVDHDHGTRQVRGLLCRSCNLMLGLAKDKPDVLLAASQYLTRTS